MMGANLALDNQYIPKLCSSSTNISGHGDSKKTRGEQLGRKLADRPSYQG